MCKRLSFFTLALMVFGCASNYQGVRYVEARKAEVTEYTIAHYTELSGLREKLVTECWFKVVESRSLTIKEHQEVKLTGAVFLALSDKGMVLDSYYRTNNLSAKTCVENVSLGYRLPPSKNLEYIFLKFQNEYEI